MTTNSETKLIIKPKQLNAVNTYVNDDTLVTHQKPEKSKGNSIIIINNSFESGIEAHEHTHKHTQKIKLQN